MSKPADRPSSRYAREALALLGSRIRVARLERRLTMEEAATRAGISRALLRRVENGDPGAAIGSVFEIAAVVGVPLFEMERSRLAGHLHQTLDKLNLLPSTARSQGKVVKDDF